MGDAMLHNLGGNGFILCVGVTLQEVAQVARLVRERAVVLAAGDLGAARALLAPAAGERPPGEFLRGLDGRAPEPMPVATATGTDGVERSSTIAGPKPRQPETGMPIEMTPPAHVRLRAGRLAIDLAAREATVDGRAIHLSAREFDLLALLASDVGRVWTFAELTEQIWDSDFHGDKEQLVSTVKRLRRRLAGHRGHEVRSVHGIGYRLRVASA
jgi:DNA-binding winged helix-turn-helix (wHTH) protein